LATWNFKARNSSVAEERAMTGCRIAWHKPVTAPPSADAVDFQLDSRRCVPDFRTLDHASMSIQVGHGVGDGVGLPLSSVITDEDITDVFVAMLNLATDLKTMWAIGWKLDYLKLAPIGDWGRYPLNAQAHIATPKTDITEAGTPTWTMSNACAITLGTAKRGRGSTGRMYWPYAQTTGNGWQAAAVDTTMKTKSATFVEKIANPPAGLDAGRWRFRVIVARRATLGLTAPYHRGSVVNHVRFGDRIDIQRRRLNSRPEVYTRHTVANLELQ
jgi:hypothetical protein